MRLAIFDFDGTLIPFESADLWVDAIARASGRPRLGLDRLRRLLFPHPFLRGAWHKRLVLRRIAGLSASAAETWGESFWREALRPRLSAALLARLDQHRRAGLVPVLATANYEPLARLVGRDLGFDQVVATRLALHAGAFTGAIDGDDCRAEEKVRRLHAAFDGRSVDWPASVAYADTRSDLPLLRAVGRGVVVRAGPAPAWAAGLELLTP